MNKRKFLFFLFKFFITSTIFFKSTKLTLSKIISSKNTLVLVHEDFTKHKLSKNHPEKPERIEKIIKFLKKNNLYYLVEYFKSDRDVYSWIRNIHTRNHIKSLKKNFPAGELSSYTAVKACIFGIDEIMKKNIRNVFCASRPPGHHALNTGKDEGFCFYNHIAIAAKYIQKIIKKKY